MSPEQQTKALRDALNLVYYYNNNSQVKKAVDQAILTRANAPGLNHPPLFYASILMSYSKKFSDYFRKDLAGVKQFPEKVDDFFTFCYRNRTEYNRLTTLTHNNQPEQTAKPLPNYPYRGYDLSATLPLILLNTYTNKLSASEKQQFSILVGKIKQFENALSVPTIRQRIIEEGHFSKKEIDLILKSGLARGLNPNKFKNDEEWKKAVAQTAAGIVVSRRSKPIVKAAKKIYGLITQDREKKAAVQEAEHIINPSLKKASAFTGLVGGITGFGLAGPVGGAAGVITGITAPTLITRGFGGVVLKAGNSLANTMGSISTGFISIPIQIATRPLKWLLWGALTILAIFMIASSSPTGFPGSNTNPAAGTADINSCQLRRSNLIPKDAPLKSTILAGYFLEAERLTTVPAQVLAGIARLENSTFTSGADDSHDAFFDRNYSDLSTSCAPHFITSPTGALGLMQIQPATSLVPNARADAYDREGVNFGASFFGKTAETLTIADFCDPQKNILIAAGFILKKLQLGYREIDINEPNPKWNPEWTNDKIIIDKVASGFYGCLPYGGPDPLKCEGPYSYGDDLWASVQSCKIIPLAYTPGVVPPVDPDPIKLRQDIIREFGVDFDSTFPYDYLKWSWQKFWQVKNTKFMDLLRGPEKKNLIVTRNDFGINRQIDCRTIQLRGKNNDGVSYPEQLFKVVLIHELSHIIEQENCTPITSSKKNQLQAIISQEGYLTQYSANTNTCVGGGTVELNEDYAEMISYFLNEYPEQSLGIHAACEPKPEPNQPVKNPYQDGKKPLHKQLVSDILGAQAPTPTPTPSQTTAALPKFSCPVVGGGRNRLASFQADPVDGHCGSAYNTKLSNPADQCVGNTRRGKSIDIETGGPEGKYVGLPTIDGKPTEWEFVQEIPLTKTDCFEDEIVDPTGAGGGCGIGYVFKTPANSAAGNWVIHLLHMQPVALTPGLKYQSGPVNLIGKSQAIHIHISLGQNITDPMSQNEPGWKSVDKELHLCE